MNLRLLLLLVATHTIALPYSYASIITVGKGKMCTSIQCALRLSKHNDTIMVYEGRYTQTPLIIDKPVSLIGINKPVIDGQHKGELVAIKADSVLLRGFRIEHSGYGTLEDPAGIKVYDSRNVTIEQNELDDNFFGIYLQYSKHCIVRHNRITAYGKEEQKIGNGIHCWKSDTLQITGNTISGHRDGIYFEFVNGSVIRGNYAHKNIRYGLHFMFSNHDVYLANRFEHNGAGVAVMFSKQVSMYNNTFHDNWGDAAYGLLLKELSDGEISGNLFDSNTSGIYMEGSSRMKVEKNIFKNNGYGMTIQASCMDNSVKSNNFLGNTFDVSTNGTLVLNKFEYNYWDKYTGYDLDKDGKGDVPYHPLSLYSLIIEKNPPAIILFRSFMAALLDKTEQLMPSLTPENFVDQTPMMRAIAL